VPTPGFNEDIVQSKGHSDHSQESQVVVVEVDMVHLHPQNLVDMVPQHNQVVMELPKRSQAMVVVVEREDLDYQILVEL
jgi:hypothetical protein